MLYEGMFLIDNDKVRAGWKEAKSLVTDTIEKHGGSVRTARRWDERRLAYAIRGRTRATYLLVHYDLPSEAMGAFVRDLEIRDAVLRQLNLRVDAIPEGEQELHEAELADDFTVPEPPPEAPVAVAPEFEERPEPVREEAEASEDADSDSGSDSDEDSGEDEGEGEEGKEGSKGEASDESSEERPKPPAADRPPAGAAVGASDDDESEES